MAKNLNRHPKRMVTRILQAFARHDVVYVEAYCQAPACAVRQVAFWVKDYDKGVAAHLKAGYGLRCPVCHELLTLHAARPLPEQGAEEDRAARYSVNRQIAERDAEQATPPNSIAVVDLRDLLNDALPPYAGAKDDSR